MYTGKITIKKTDENELNNVRKLWNDGEVMFYVGFPNGLNITFEKLEKWLKSVNNNEQCRHYSIYSEDIGYCGESFYSIDLEHDLATLDIKLFPDARGKGIAEYALRYTLNQVFENNLASRAYVDPNPQNTSAWKLYDKLGFISKERPSHLEPDEVYLELTKDMWHKWNIK